jgi:hypothetical protein
LTVSSKISQGVEQEEGRGGGEEIIYEPESEVRSIVLQFQKVLRIPKKRLA